MAEGQTRGRAADTDEERKPTRRVVLRQERALVLPEGVRVEELVAASNERELMKLLGLKVGTDPYSVAWIVVGEFEGQTKDKAIEAYAGKPGTPDAKVGTFKAPGAAAWAGGARYKAPPKPLVEKETID